MKLTDTMYNNLKWIAMIFLPALAVLVSTVIPLWGFCSAETVNAIVGTISAVDVFLGALLGISSKNYNEGK